MKLEHYGWHPLPAPKDGTRVVFISSFDRCSDVVAWNHEHGRFEHESGHGTTMQDDLAWDAWANAPPRKDALRTDAFLPGIEERHHG